MTSGRLIALSLCAFLTVACEKDGDGGGDNPDGPGGQGEGSVKLKEKLDLDFANVTGFVITGSTSGGAGFVDGEGDPSSATSTQKLYSIGEDGVLTEVTVTESTTTNEDGTTTTTTTSASQSLNPTAVYDTPKVAFFEFNSLSIDNQPCFTVAAKKSDGAL